MEHLQDFVFEQKIILLLQVCQMIHLCPAEPEAVASKDDVSCVMCEYAMTQLDQMLGDHKTEVRQYSLPSSAHYFFAYACMSVFLFI